MIRLRLLSIICFVLSCGTAFGWDVILYDQVAVTPTNAAQHNVTFKYGPTTEVDARGSTRVGAHKFVFVRMACTNGEVPYCSAVLECTNSARHFSIPIEAKRIVLEADNQEWIVIEFIMDDRQTVRECKLSILLGKDIRRATAYVLSLKDFIPDGEVSADK